MASPFEPHHYDLSDTEAAHLLAATAGEISSDEGIVEDDEEPYITDVPSPTASHDAPHTPDPSDEAIVMPDESPNCAAEGKKRRRTEEGQSSGSDDNAWNRTEIDGLVCPICMDVWTNKGEHHICCLPCGHIYGMSCIKRWLQRRAGSANCPQCNRKCSMKDVRKLYASRVVAVDEESHKRIRLLEAKCIALESKDTDWQKKEAGWQKSEAALHLQVQKLTEASLKDIADSKKQGQVYNTADLFANVWRGMSSLSESQNQIPSAGSVTLEERITRTEQRIAILEQQIQAVILWTGATYAGRDAAN
ncbi:E3 ubiquitin-protein ligase RFWD3 isoform X2 [Cajanus cajan]|uniref:E3 ubiquitin-protein ligase RFWD3 isoform X2 n=1 Tax=Cajanus cajan TaxID=3821 RepID=UPI00098DC8DE|nr:E3 ubiquitin-protein ligase RFWD3 isoform X2 [Cajanus cajan]